MTSSPTRLLRSALFTLLAVFGFGRLLLSAEERVLTVDQAVAMALQRNLSLEAGRIELDAKKRKADDSWNAFLPTVDLGANLVRMNEDQSTSVTLPFDGGSVTTATGVYDNVYYRSIALPTWNLSASLSAQLALNLGLVESMRGAGLEYEAGRLSYAEAERRLERDVRKSFYGILLLEENMGLVQATIDAAKRRLDQAEANFKAGRAPELAFLQARVAYENLKPGLEEMRVGYAAALDGFAMILGLPRGETLRLAGSIEPMTAASLDANELVRGRLGDRFDVQTLSKTIQVLQSAKKSVELQMFTPSLVLGWNFDPTFMGDPFKDDWTKGASYNTGDAWQQQSGMFRASLGFRLNALLPQSKEAQSLADLRDAIAKTRNGLAQTIRGAELEIDSLVRKLEKSRASSAALELNVDLADRAYKLAEEAYRAGVKDLLDVQSAELELRKAQLGVLAENHTYVTGLLDLEYAVNLPFGSLARLAN